jgi:hypothetical protein
LLVLGVLACASRSKPAASVARDAPAAVVADCGDLPAADDACPLLDGCPGSARDAGPADEGEDGCPGPGGIPAATDCHADEARLAAIARAIRQRPGLTALRVVSGVPGCAEHLRSGIVHAGVGAVALVAATEGTEDRCTPWARFAVTEWRGETCR